MKMTQYRLSNMSESVASQYEAEKLDWIAINASNRLQGLVAAGYDANELYISERLSIDFPEFELTDDLSIIKADSPPEFCLLACQNFTDAYCSVPRYISNGTFYITIDNFLGGISIAKKIHPPVVVIEDEDSDSLKQSTPNVRSEDPYAQDKRAWIFLCGSNLLKQSFQDGYDCEERYVNERAESDFPGFSIGHNSFEKMDSPSEYLLQCCDRIPEAYCTNDKYSKSEYYLTIDNYLGKHKIIKSISHPDEEIMLTQSDFRNHSIVRRYPVLVVFICLPVLLLILSKFLIVSPVSTPSIHHKIPKSTSPIEGR
jgi:hypothetical protein